MASEWKRKELRFKNGFFSVDYNMESNGSRLVKFMSGDHFDKVEIPPKASKIIIHIEPEVGMLKVDYMVG